MRYIAYHLISCLPSLVSLFSQTPPSSLKMRQECYLHINKLKPIAHIFGGAPAGIPDQQLVVRYFISGIEIFI